MNHLAWIDGCKGLIFPLATLAAVAVLAFLMRDKGGRNDR